MEIPKIVDRALWDDDEPDGYLESDLDWMRANWEACIWFLENRDEICNIIENRR